jgi:hypothetical protein
MYGMRRMIFAVALLTAATATAIDTNVHPIRIAMLAQPAQLDAFRDRLEKTDTIKDLGDERLPADYYVEILGAGGSSRPVAGVGAGPVDVGVSVSHVGASVNVYDGRTLALVEAIDLRKRSTNVMPVGVYFGNRPVWAAISLPIFEWSQYRNAMRRLARDTARDIDRVVRR